MKNAAAAQASMNAHMPPIIHPVLLLFSFMITPPLQLPNRYIHIMHYRGRNVNPFLPDFRIIFALRRQNIHVITSKETVI